MDVLCSLQCMADPDENKSSPFWSLVIEYHHHHSSAIRTKAATCKDTSLSCCSGSDQIYTAMWNKSCLYRIAL
eukprot:6037-Heterococcus_DN1.PRE.2